MGNAYGASSQGSTITIGSVGPLKCTRIKLRNPYHNADTTVTDEGFSKLAPIYQDWMLDVEMPVRTADASDTITEAFDTDAFPPNVEDVTIPDCTFALSNGTTYSGAAMLDGEVQVIVDAKDAIRLVFTVKGSGVLNQT